MGPTKGGENRNGEERIRDANKPKSKRMGTIGGCISHQDNDSGVKTVLFRKARSKTCSPNKLSHFRKDHFGIRRRLSSQMGGKEDCEGDFISYASSLLNNVHEAQKEWEIAPNHRPQSTQRHAHSREIQNGDSGSDFSDCSGDTLGLFDRHRGRLFPRSHKLGIPQIPCLQDKEQNICVPVPPIRAVTSSVGFHEGTQTSKSQASFSINNDIQLHRRLFSVSRVPRTVVAERSGSFGAVAEVRVQSELEEIPTHSHAELTVLGGRLGSPEQDFGGAARENCGDLNQLQASRGSEYDVKERDRETDGEAGLCSNLHPAGQALSVAAVDLDESSHKDRDEGCSSASRSPVQKQAEDLGGQGVSGTSGSICGGAAESYGDDGCLAGGLVRGPAAPESYGVLGSGCCSSVNQLERIESGVSYAKGTQVSVVRSLHQAPLGQYDNSCLSEENGVGAGRTSAQLDNGDLGILQGAQHPFDSGTFEGGEQCSGGSGLQSESSEHGMEIGCRDVQLASAIVPRDGDRLVCDEDELPSSEVHVSFSGRSSSGLQCIQQGLERVEVHLPVSSDEYPRRSLAQAGRVSRIGVLNRSSLAVSELVPHVEEEVLERSHSPSREPFPESMDFEGFGEGLEQGLLEPSRLATLISFLPEGCNEETRNMIIGAHRSGTVKQYQGSWGKFLAFLEDKNIAHDRVSMGVVMNFLAHCVCSLKLEYRTVAAYKCGLEIPLKLVYNLSFDDIIFKLFMRGIFNHNPPRRAKPGPSWMLDILLSYLGSDVFEPLGSKSVEIKTMKLLCLLLLATGRRIGEISNLSSKHQFLNGGNDVQLFWLKGFTAKYLNESFSPKPPVVEALVLGPDGDDKLCPVRALSIFINTAHIGRRCVSEVPFWTVGCAKLSRLFITCVSNSLNYAHVPPVDDIGPHQMRKLAASYCVRMMGTDSSLRQKMLDRMGCKSFTVLKKVYIQDVPDLDTRCVLPVGTYVPTE